MRYQAILRMQMNKPDLQSLIYLKRGNGTSQQCIHLVARNLRLDCSGAIEYNLRTSAKCLLTVVHR